MPVIDRLVDNIVVTPDTVAALRVAERRMQGTHPAIAAAVASVVRQLLMRER